MTTRRQFSLGLGLGATLATATLHHAAAAPTDLAPALAAIEAQCGGRLGVSILDTATNQVTSHRGDEHFPMLSTHKALTAAAILRRVDQQQERLDRVISFTARDVMAYSPVTKPHADGPGMTLASICEAAVTLSDNTAANLIFTALGGPEGATAIIRETGDPITRMDRTEPTLNEARPGDVRDTTTPLAMATTMQRLALGDALRPASRTQLADWLIAGKTGATRLRAGLPPAWRVGDKTGTNTHGTSNDIGIFWPPGRAPLVVTAFITASTASQQAQDAAIAAVARLVATNWA